ncbi:MAG: type IV CRISPR-associated protein Csf1 [Betaproteobacteria bacterium]
MNLNRLPSHASTALPLLAPISPSAIYRAAAKRDRTGDVIAAFECLCNACGATIQRGEACAPALYPKSFGNQMDLRCKASNWICADCATIFGSKDFLTRFSKTVANADGIYKLAATEDGAALITNPPQTPFVAIFSTRNAQHMVWRTPVTYSRDLIFLRLDDEVMTIRRQVVLAAFEDWKFLTELLWTHPDKAMKKARVIYSTPLLDHRSVGAVFSRVERWAIECGEEARVNRINSLTSGEWWGLHRLIYTKPQKQLAEMVLAGEPGSSEAQEDLESEAAEA